MVISGGQGTGVDRGTAWRLRVYPLAILATLAIALVVATVRYDVNDPASRLGGDYPSFYGAGSIVAAGDWDELYDPERQQSEQAGLIDDEGGYLYFSYPPFVAAGYGLLARLGYQWSFLVHTVLMMLALAGAAWALSPWLGRTALPLGAVLIITLAFYPVFTSVLGGQNTALSLLLFALAARCDHDDRPYVAGLVASLLLFKPQFGVVVLPLLLVARRWRVLAGWGVGTAFLAAVSTALMGVGWVGDWWTQARAFSEQNVVANGPNFISLPGFLENLWGAGSGPAQVIGYGLGVVVALAVAWEWWRHPSREALWRWGLAAGAAMALAPQTLFYDAGLLLLAMVALVPAWRRPAVVVVVLAGLSWLQIAKGALGWSPLGPLALAGLAFLLIQAGRRPASVPGEA